MGLLKNKMVLVISPQDWGKMLLSKHHYAIELAKLGNKVYFLNPPDQQAQMKRGEIVVRESSIHPDLHMITHRLYFPFAIKFKSLSLFHFLMARQVRKIIRTIGHTPDIVWSFDIGNLYPFRLFAQVPLKVFHPVDEPLQPAAIAAAGGASAIFSVTSEILAKYHQYPIPKHFIHHGVSEAFLSKLSAENWKPSQTIRVGYSGNMLRGDIDRQTVLNIVTENPAVEFHFFGSYENKQSNIGGSGSAASVDFISHLQLLPNVKMRGVLSQDELAEAFNQMDAFLVCYDIQKDQSKGTNYHKLMEYIGTGKVIISNNVTTYQQLPDIISMTASREHNNELPALFRQIIGNLSQHNSEEKMAARRAFARDNTYPAQLKRIEGLLSKLP